MATQSQSKDSKIEQLQRAYNADQQVKYIHLEAEIDLLLHQVQAQQNKIK
ncbi:hypothetical protein AA637_07700 [Cyanobacterium sp. HL-69]|nr:hypothetical protein [Cyanobacterium sp. IPPAS B-1200]AUC61044.1 hypothetical protein AA637_07700 [Cyanobacterium sp. HL-69]